MGIEEPLGNRDEAREETANCCSFKTLVSSGDIERQKAYMEALCMEVVSGKECCSLGRLLPARHVVLPSRVANYFLF